MHLREKCLMTWNTLISVVSFSIKNIFFVLNYDLSSCKLSLSSALRDNRESKTYLFLMIAIQIFAILFHFVHFPKVLSTVCIYSFINCPLIIDLSRILVAPLLFYYKLPKLLKCHTLFNLTLQIEPLSLQNTTEWCLTYYRFKHQIC